MHGGNVARLLGVLAQRLAQEAQTGGERPLADHRLGPHRVEQRRFADHLPGLARQLPQHGQGLGRHRHQLGMMPQRALGPFQAIGTEVQGQVWWHGAPPLGAAQDGSET